MSARSAAVIGGAFGGAWGGLLSGGIARYLAGGTHYLPLWAGAVLGGALGGLLTAVVTHRNLRESAHEEGDPQSSR